MSRQKEFIFEGIDLSDLRDALTTMIVREGLDFTLEQVARCRDASGCRVGWKGIRDCTTIVMREEGTLSEDAGKDQCDKLRKAMRAFLEIE